MQAVALALGKYPPEALGVGMVSRIARPLQREFIGRAPIVESDDDEIRRRVSR